MNLKIKCLAAFYIAVSPAAYAADGTETIDSTTTKPAPFYATLAWNNWHKSVNDALTQIAETACRGQKIEAEEAKSCAWSFKISNDGTISQILYIEKSTDAYFNLLCIRSLEELGKKQALTAFPAESKALFIRECATFKMLPKEDSTPVIQTTLGPGQRQKENPSWN